MIFVCVVYWVYLESHVDKELSRVAFSLYMLRDVHPFLSQNVFSSIAFFMLSVYMFVIFIVSLASSHVRKKESNTLNTVTSLHQSSELFLLLTWL